MLLIPFFSFQSVKFGTYEAIDVLFLLYFFYQNYVCISEEKSLYDFFFRTKVSKSYDKIAEATAYRYLVFGRNVWISFVTFVCQIM